MFAVPYLVVAWATCARTRSRYLSAWAFVLHTVVCTWLVFASASPFYFPAVPRRLANLAVLLSWLVLVGSHVVIGLLRPESLVQRFVKRPHLLVLHLWTHLWPAALPLLLPPPTFSVWALDLWDVLVLAAVCGAYHAVYDARRVYLRPKPQQPTERFHVRVV